MMHLLKNDLLELEIDLPDEGYRFSRFDWSGKITKVKFKGVDVSTKERTDNVNEHDFGKGLYNEFGIDNALGYEDAVVGDWFHKIGVGLLKKDDKTYAFHKSYEIHPLAYKIHQSPKGITLECESELINGYGYILQKEITLFEAHFKISYRLDNTGQKPLVTDEYIHNFVALDNELIGSNYILRFPFELKPERFNDYVNPDNKIIIGGKEITFRGGHEEQFFFSNVSGNTSVDAKWELVNLKSKIKISEEGSFKTNKINLWGWQHVVCPELFYHIHLEAGQSTEWERTYRFESLE